MIKITKDNDVKIVTKGAYKSFYEHLGYNIVDEEKKYQKDNDSRNSNKKAKNKGK